MTFAAVCLVGGLGAVCRFGLDSLVSRRAPGGWGTFAANAVGCLLLGVAVACPGMPPQAARILTTGFFGGFTTFSTAMADAVRHLERGARRTPRPISSARTEPDWLPWSSDASSARPCERPKAHNPTRVNAIRDTIVA